MNNKHVYKDSIESSVTDEIEFGYISYSTFLLFIKADEDKDNMSWLELNLIAIERYIKKGHEFSIQGELKTIVIHNIREFYLWCSATLPNSYHMFLQYRSY
tara:strand:- start:97 stop:399 length:303 start_codon:yes stop_codon:yes gene_type:complete